MNFNISGKTIRQISSLYGWIDNVSDSQILDVIEELYRSLYHDTPHMRRGTYQDKALRYINVNIDFINSLMRPFSKKDIYFLPIKTHHLSLILLDQLQCPSDTNVITTLDDAGFILECSHDDAIRYKLMF